MILDCKGIIEALEAVEAKVLQAQADGAALKATPEKAEAFLPKLRRDQGGYVKPPRCGQAEEVQVCCLPDRD